MQDSLRTEIEKYVESKRHIWSATTLRSVHSKLRTLAPRIDSPADAYKWLIENKYGRYTIKTYFIIASSFEGEVYNSSKFHTFLQKNKAAFKNCYQDKQRNLKPAEYETFLKKFEGKPQMWNLLVLMGRAGLRISEAKAVKWSDFSDGDLFIRGKGGKVRKAPLEQGLLKASGSEFVVTAFNHRKVFERELAPFTPHDFRAYYATQVANHPELNLKDAAMLLGHSSVMTTSRYVRSDYDRVKKELSR